MPSHHVPVHAGSLSSSSADTHRLLASWVKNVETKGALAGRKAQRPTISKKSLRDISGMKPGCLLSTVDRLPTINEMQESRTEDGDPDCYSHTMEEYLDSIKELSQPAPYPLHGPLRGHRRWMVRTCRRVTPAPPSKFFYSCRTYAPWIPVDLSDVSLTLTDQSNCDPSLHFNQNLLDRLLA